MHKIKKYIKKILTVEVVDNGEAKNRIELRKQTLRNIVLFIIVLLSIYLYVQSGVNFESDLATS